MKISCLIGFCVGAVVGAAAIYIYEEQKYQDFYEKEIAPVKNKLTNLIAELSKVSEDKEEKKGETKIEKKGSDDLISYVKKVSDYKNYSNPSVMVEDDEEIPPPKEYFGDPNATPVIITPEEFGDDEEYDKVSLF